MELPKSSIRKSSTLPDFLEMSTMTVHYRHVYCSTCRVHQNSSGSFSSSLPLSNESYVVSFGNCVTSMLVATSTPSGPTSRSRDVSPSSSIRRSRLSIVAEDTKTGDTGAATVRVGSLDEELLTPSPENPLLPSIKVTSF